MEAALPALASARARRFSFVQKLVLAILLIALGDRLFFRQHLGSTVGLYALALLLSALSALPAVRRSRAALAAAGAALLYAAALGDDPSLLAWGLFWAAASLAVLVARMARFDDGWRWALRLLLHALLSAFGPVRDWRVLRRARVRRGPFGLSRAARLLIIPAVGSAVFLALFSAANPLIGRAFARIDLGVVVAGLAPPRLIFWLLLAILVWGLLRAPRYLVPSAAPRDGGLAAPSLAPASIAISLLAFNAIFALQNGLDITFLWSGAPLPGELTLAEYAHRGAYPLIATALLAALFVLVTLQPGSATAESPLIRRLVYLWIGQNVLLVASTMLRTVDYIEAYSLTRLRIAALVWMALVAIGLVLICYRVWRARGAGWLINANFAAAALALTGCAFVDLGAVAAQWNVRHAREAGGAGTHLDVCYLRQLGPSALLPLIELEGRRLPADLGARIAWVRSAALQELERSQSDWHGWTFRNHRRLGEAQRLAAARRLPRLPLDERSCDGRPVAVPTAALDSRSGDM